MSPGRLLTHGKLASRRKLLFGMHRRELEPSAARPSGQGELLGCFSTRGSAAIRRSERTTAILAVLARGLLPKADAINPHPLSFLERAGFGCSDLQCSTVTPRRSSSLVCAFAGC